MRVLSNASSKGLLSCLMVLSCVGCGGSGDNKTSGANVPDTAQSRINNALTTGDSAVLKAEDANVLLNQANDSSQQTALTQSQLLNDFYKADSVLYAEVAESLFIQPSPKNKDNVFPIVIGDKGNVLASLSKVGDGRIAGYGYDILGGFDLVNNKFATHQQDHQPVFKRVLAWLVFGNAAQNLSSQNLNIAWGSLPTTTTVMYKNTSNANVYKPFAAAGLTALGVPYTSLSCDPLFDPVADCAAKAHLVVIGAADKTKNANALPLQLARIKEIVQKKIPVLYMNAHPNGGPYGTANDGASQQFTEDYERLQTLGFASGLSPVKSNYNIKDAVRTTVTLDSLKTRFSQTSLLLNNMISRKFTAKYDWSKCTDFNNCILSNEFINELQTPIDSLKKELDNLNVNALSLFDGSTGNKSLQLLVLWADAYRKSLVYPIDKTDQEKFRLAYLADSLVAYVRPAGSAQADLGSFSDPQASQVIGSAVAETVTVTIPVASGFTAIGRYALPGKPLTISLQSMPTQGDALFFVNTANANNTKQFEQTSAQYKTQGYSRPIYPQSNSFALSTKPITIVSPYGGILELKLNGVTDKSLVLNIAGAAKHPFYDATQSPPSAVAFLNDMQNSKLAWFEIKTAGLEFHALISLFFKSLVPTTDNGSYPNSTKPYYSSQTKTIDLEKYLFELQNYYIDDAYALAGFQVGNVTLNSFIKSYCNQHAWDCTSTSIHSPPPLQHFHSDHRAQCGYMCSGNPITSGGGLEPRGWGESHEMGHNLQRFNIYDTLSGEVENNIFPKHKRWHLFRAIGHDALGDNLTDFNGIQNALDTVRRIHQDITLTTREQKIAAVKAQFWTNPAYAAQNTQRVDFYYQWPIIYFVALKDRHTFSTDAETWDHAWDVVTLLYLHHRQIVAMSNTDWTNKKANFGFANYASKPATSPATKDANGVYLHHDYLLVSLSFISGVNWKEIFDLWGIETTTVGRTQVDALRDSAGAPLPVLPATFYATVCRDDYRTYAALKMDDANLIFPASWKTQTPFASDAVNKQACIDATAALPK